MSVPAENGIYFRFAGWLFRLCDGLALIGGAFMVVAMLMLVAHVIGNAFGAPILGVTEIVERLIGASIFCFLAPCQLKGANIVVDYFSKPLPEWMRNWSDVLVTLVFALVALVLTWRLGAGGMSAFTRNKQSMFLGLPEWPVYLVGTIACVIWVITILFSTWTAVRVATGLSVPQETTIHG